MHYKAFVLGLLAREVYMKFVVCRRLACIRAGKWLRKNL